MAFLKKVVESEADIPEGLSSIYEERDGKWHLKTSEIEGYVSGGSSVESINRLQKALEKERTDHKTTKAKLAEKDSEIVAFQEKVEVLEAASGGKPDDAKINEIVQARVKAQTAPLNRKIDELNGQLTAKETEIVAFQTEARRTKIAQAVGSLASKAKIVETGIDDVVDLAVRAFDLTEDGRMVTRENSGFTPGLNPEEFIGELRNKKPHLWPTSVGGGATGGGAGQNGVNWAKMNMTERSAYVRQHGVEKATQIAKAAGFANVGDMKPTLNNK